MRHAIGGARWAWMAAAVVGLGVLSVRPQAGAMTRQGQAMTTPKTIGTLLKADPRFDALVAPGTPLEVLADGYDWAEGPVWVKRDGGFLLWSDVPANTIYKWAPGQAAAPFMKPSGFTGVGKYSAEPGSNGLTLDREGRLVAAEHGDRRVSRYDWMGGKRTLADNWQGKRFNSPNDVIVKSNGDVYFTDPIYGLPDREHDKTRETDFCGVYRWSATTHEVTLLTKDMSRPNGLAFSPDEKILYVANSDPVKAVWMAFPVTADGTIGAGTVVRDVTSMVGDKNPGLPDGMRVDAKGNLFASGPGGIHVMAPDGTLLGRIETGQATANCVFGGSDGSELYLTADMYIVRLKTKTKGAGL
jgi:gluconolactonase